MLQGLIPIEREIKDAQGQWYLMRLRPYSTLEHRIAGIVLTIADITERKDTEQALRRSEERMRPVVDNAVDCAIFSMNLEGRVIFWNSGAERLLGYTEAEVLDKSCAIIFTEEDRQAGVPDLDMKSALEAGSAADDRLHRRKDGRRFRASGSMTLMHDTDRRVAGFVKILRDQTLPREAQESIAAGRVHLLHALDENERARLGLEAADVAEDRFLAVLSHELRDPLAAISGASAAYAVAGPGDGELVARARRILMQQVGTMSSLRDELLDISRLRLGRFELKRRLAALATIVDAAAQAARPRLAQRQHTLSTDLPPETVLLDVDAARISQVICNLLVNAAEYTSPGGRIAVSASRTDSEVSITIAISDDGGGLDPQALASVLALSWRAPDLDSASGQSVGIGLSLARNIVELHHGALTTHSEGSHEGSQFVIKLPIATRVPRDPADSPDVARHSAGSNGAIDGDRADLRVLLADANEDVVWTQGAVLAARGSKVRIAMSGEQALQVRHEFRPHVAVLDSAMPGLKGTEVASRARQQPWGRDMLLIAATGWGTDLDRQRSLDAGFDDHLVKPIKLDDLTT